jgi:hypothetical protein
VADRLPYNQAIATSWKEQTLLNIVKLRYMDTPFFIDVSQVTGGYTFQSAATANGGIFPPASPAASFSQQLGAGLNLQGGYQDRPTISYLPQTGSQFIRNITQPINPGSVLFLLQSGYPAEVVFGLTVETVNGLKNRSVAGGRLRPADPEFEWMVHALGRAQASGHVGIRITRENNKDSAAFFFHDQDIDPGLAEEMKEVRRTLRLDPKKQEFRVAFGATAANDNEITILSRSIVRILSELSTHVVVPKEHLKCGIAPDLGEVIYVSEPPFHVCSSCEKPADPFVSVFYEGYWFWVEKSDFRSKRTIAYLLALLALSDTGAKEGLPVITIQAN